MEQICVFCGSSLGKKGEYIDAAKLLGYTLAKRNITLIYGGSRVGLMGQLAKACLEEGGKVIGVITKSLVDMKVAHTQLTQLYVVETMHERKSKMEESADGFIAMPGGFGTIEEFFEILTWTQLGMHQKPCGLLNICQYYNKLIDFLDYAVEQQFVDKIHRNIIQIDENPDELLKKLETYKAPKINKAEWVLNNNSLIKSIGI